MSAARPIRMMRAGKCFSDLTDFCNRTTRRHQCHLNRIVQFLAILLLAVGCVNVGMLVFARTAGRSSELAVRTALGASRARVVTQLFTEAMVFAVIAAGKGGKKK